MTIVETILDGVLAAGAGLLVTEYEARKAEGRKKEQWKQRFNHFLTWFETDIGPNDDPGTDERWAYVKSSSELVNLLEDHIATRERPLAEATLEEFSNLRTDVARLEEVADRNIVDGKVTTNIERVSRTANEMKDGF